ncbi:transcriptional regulator [Actinoplanes ianthinogenes]|uniref:Transcriptional regulator n=1 Tax=Actinoplanes ianthinogenes TaxID=122358 RepID=A0ABM7M209_9ACTN|nr:LuxR family transcriptional regulator [Actinoplanes ianthinogenes]BCJ45620.1 transcriptional regulator [Actinoplanes ianthinogenes]GGR57338.1 transcriptional regulator [Actinoplanes ianthinogenes]
MGEHTGDGVVGRQTERARIDAVLARTREGSGQALLIRGEPGIGKTTLLAYARSTATGFRTLRAAGTPAEWELPYAALYALLRPILEHRDELPAVQAAALTAVFALGADPAAPVNRLAVYGATLGLLAAAAERAPVLCLVDDAHGIDPASAGALRFAARALHAEPVALLFAARTAPHPQASGFDAAGLDTLHLTGLDADSSAALAVRAGMAPRAAHRLAAATAGNPLALLELPAALTEAQRSGRAPLTDPLPSTAQLDEVFLTRAWALGAPAWRALVACAIDDGVAAASGPEPAGISEPADSGGPADAGSTGSGPAGVDPAALDPAIAAGMLVVRDGAVTFRHPLIRAAVHAAALPGELRAAHLAAAAALTDPQQADRRAWHRAAAATGPDEEIAAALVRSARRARARGGQVAEARAYARAAELSPDPDDRADRRQRAAEAWAYSGAGEHAERLLDQVLAEEAPVAVRCRAEWVRAWLLRLRGDLSVFDDDYLRRAEKYAAEAPREAVAMVSQAANAYWARLDAPGLLAICRRAVAIHDEPGYLKGRIRLAGALVLTGDPEGATLARSCVPGVRQAPADGAAAELAEVLTWLGDHPTAGDLLTAEAAGARRDSDLALLAYTLPRLAVLEARRGRLHRAYQAGSEALRIAEEFGQDGPLADALAVLAQVAALHGAAAESTALAGRAATVGPPGRRSLLVQLAYARGLNLIAAGRPGAATEFGTALALLDAGGIREPGFLPVLPELAEAMIRDSGPLGGRRRSPAGDAIALLDRLAGVAAGTGVLARCRGLAAPEDEMDEHFAAAVALPGSPVDRARTLFAWGQRLRRARRRRDARMRLHAALDGFTEAGADGWAAQCRTEIAATGRGAAPAADPVEGLTAQEWQVALTAAEGLSNREIAARMFLSPRTVEHHLGSVYRKLGLRSRGELTRRLADR